MELIKMPVSLGLMVAKILQNKNIKPRVHESGPFKGTLSLEFTQEELDLITELEIKNPTSNSLEGIEYLENLETLSLSTFGVTAYQILPTSINDKDIKKISKLKKLKSLTIDNQPNISWLLLDDLQNLEELCITRNSNLEEIIGLDKLSKLHSFEERGNKSLYQIDGIHALINNNNLDTFEVDVLHYPDVMNESKKLGNLVNCTFSEQISTGQHKCINYSFYQMLLFHRKCLEIAKQAKESSIDVRTQILFVEKYLAENITYDTVGVKSDNRAYSVDGKQKGKNYGTNSAYNGIMFGSAVCEGYTRSMQYILKLMGIKTKDVHCIGDKDAIKINKSYHNQLTLPDDDFHSIIRIDNNNEIYYFDPCWDSSRWHRGDRSLPYSFLTKKEISETHTLSFEENDVIYDVPFPREYISSALELFNKKENTSSHVR